MEGLKSGKDFEIKGGNPAERSVYQWLILAGMLMVVFVSASIFYVWMYIQQVQNGYRLARLYQEHEQLLAVQRKLRLEWCRFDDPYQLEELGSKQFGLAPPRPEQKVLMR